MIWTNLKRYVARVRAGAFQLALCAALLSAQVSSSAQENAPKDLKYYYQQATRAYEAKDYPAFLDNLKMAQSLRPSSPRLMYNLACAYALAGNKRESIEWLDRVASMGLVYPASGDTDLDSIKGTDEFEAILKKFDLNKAPINHSAAAFRISEKGLITEGLAYDPATSTFYISSVHRRKIINVNRSGEAKDFSAVSDGLWSVLGMKVDPHQRALWVCTAALPQMSGFREEDKNQTGVFKYDLKTGKLLKKYVLADRSKNHVFGDLVVSTDGDVFVTDSGTPAVYVIRRQKDELEPFLESSEFESLQGLDFSADGKQLFIADYSKGIWKIDLPSKKLSLIPGPENVCALGIDGLYFSSGSLVVVQNGISPQRIARVLLNGDQTRIEKLEIIEANNPLFDELTLGVVVKNEFYYIANSQWDAIDGKGNLAVEKLQEPVILKTKL